MVAVGIGNAVSTFVALLASSAAAGSSVALTRRPLVGEASATVTPDARAQQCTVDRVFQKFLRGRISAATAAGRILDSLHQQADDEAVRGVLVQAESPQEEEKIAELMEELKHVRTVRARLLPKP